MSEESAKIIRDFIIEKNITNTVFARTACVARWTVQRYLTGSPIRPSTALKIVKNIKKTYGHTLPYDDLTK